MIKNKCSSKPSASNVPKSADEAISKGEDSRVTLNQIGIKKGLITKLKRASRNSFHVV